MKLRSAGVLLVLLLSNQAVFGQDTFEKNKKTDPGSILKNMVLQSNGGIGGGDLSGIHDEDLNYSHDENGILAELLQDGTGAPLGYKDRVRTYLKTLSDMRTSVVADDPSHKRLLELIDAGLIGDVVPKQYAPTDYCEEDGVEKTMSTHRGIKEDSVCINMPRLMKQIKNLGDDYISNWDKTENEITSLLVHEHGRHLGEEDTTVAKTHPIGTFVNKSRTFVRMVQFIRDEWNLPASRYQKITPGVYEIQTTAGKEFIIDASQEIEIIAKPLKKSCVGQEFVIKGFESLDFRNGFGSTKGKLMPTSSNYWVTFKAGEAVKLPGLKLTSTDLFAKTNLLYSAMIEPTNPKTKCEVEIWLGTQDNEFFKMSNYKVEKRDDSFMAVTEYSDLFTIPAFYAGAPEGSK